MTQLTDILRKEFIAYRQVDTLWGIIKDDEVLLKTPYYNTDDNTMDFGKIYESDTIPIVTLEVSEHTSKVKRSDVTSKDMFFYKNSMSSFCRVYRRQK